ncbi:sugar ABC transporter ATP-binding protein [Roseivivax isoporae LMG 25204]|uniref:Sugar ABC transporter ATP-binding protein n=1 Tax=Roseivivax isoporae LMG 25204 TaxID=1449351 RepID=X7F1E2_9RHOB|nr:sugar ABC transporter ATP-binding protein [Roseivivax isoporae LMG 25204]
MNLKIERGRSYHLMGENGCGKSTLIKILSGAQAATSGTVLINGVDHAGMTPIGALDAGIETVYQDLSLLPNLSVAENVGLSEQLVEHHGSLLRPLATARVRRTAERAIEVVGLPTHRGFMDTPVELLPIAQRQLVAIARGVAGNAGLVIMDEPTTALTRREVANLITVIRRLQADGTALLFVTHKLDEAREIGGTGIVMRDGEFVAEIDVETTDNDEIGYLMTGRRLQQGRYRQDTRETAGAPLLSLDGLTRPGAFDGIDLSVARGEVLGITGLLDSGRNELALALAGIMPVTRGHMRLEGRALRLDHPGTAIEAGIAYVPEDRLTEGLFLEKPIRENIAMSVLGRLRGRFRLLDRSKSDDLAQSTLSDLQIVAPDIHAPVSSLSGGNQQRVLIGRWLATNPRLLVLHGPTVGVDVGSKDTIFRIIQDQAASGMGIIIVSDDLPELLQNCDRIAVMRDHRIARILDAAATTESEIYAEMSGSDARNGVPA